MKRVLMGLTVAMTVVTGQPTRSTIARLGRPLIVLGLTAIYAVCFAAIKAGLPYMPPLRFAGLLLFLALIGTAFATAIWYWLIRRDDVGGLTLFFFIVPVFGLVIAALAFGETIGLPEGVGVAVTLAGIGAIARESWSAHAQTLTQRHTACSCGLPGCARTFAGCNRCHA